MKTKLTTFRATEDDQRLIAELKAKLGCTSTTQLIRMALRALKERS